MPICVSISILALSSGCYNDVAAPEVKRASNHGEGLLQWQKIVDDQTLLNFLMQDTVVLNF